MGILPDDIPAQQHSSRGRIEIMGVRSNHIPASEHFSRGRIKIEAPIPYVLPSQADPSVLIKVETVLADLRQALGHMPVFMEIVARIRGMPSPEHNAVQGKQKMLIPDLGEPCSHPALRIKIIGIPSKVLESCQHQAVLIEIIYRFPDRVHSAKPASYLIDIVDTPIILNKGTGLHFIIFIEKVVPLPEHKSIGNNLGGQILVLVINIHIAPNAGKPALAAGLPESSLLNVADLPILSHPFVIANGAHSVQKPVLAGIYHGVIAGPFNDGAESVGNLRLLFLCERFLHFTLNVNNHRHADGVVLYGSQHKCRLLSRLLRVRGIGIYVDARLNARRVGLGHVLVKLYVKTIFHGAHPDKGKLDAAGCNRIPVYILLPA